MIRTILLASAAALAAPALAQTAGPADAPAADSVPTTTNDHDPTEDNSGTQQYPTSTGAMSQVNGGVTASATGVPATGAAPQTPNGSTTVMGTPQGTGFDNEAAALTSESVREETAGVATDATETGAFHGQAGMAPVDRSAAAATMRDWNFGGDMGRIGTADWGVRHGGASAGGTAGGATGVGGPIDVDAEWAAIAPAGDQLTPLEFGTWMLAEQGQDVGQQVRGSMRSRASDLPAIQVLNLTGSAFLQADRNRDGRVSRDELRAFAGS